MIVSMISMYKSSSSLSGGARRWGVQYATASFCGILVVAL